jgi:hypothetical protein
VFCRGYSLFPLPIEVRRWPPKSPSPPARPVEKRLPQTIDMLIAVGRVCPVEGGKACVII